MFSTFNIKSDHFILGFQTFVSTPYLLDCSKSKKFWMSWDTDDILQVGEGDYGDYPFLNLQIPGITSGVQAVSIGTLDSHGEWEIERDSQGIM